VSLFFQGFVFLFLFKTGIIRVKKKTLSLFFEFGQKRPFPFFFLKNAEIIPVFGKFLGSADFNAVKKQLLGPRYTHTHIVRIVRLIYFLSIKKIILFIIFGFIFFFFFHEVWIFHEQSHHFHVGHVGIEIERNEMLNSISAFCQVLDVSTHCQRIA